MGWFRTPGTPKPDYTGLQLQTSVSTLPIPIVWGQTKLAGNVLWTHNFTTSGGGGGKGGLFGSNQSGYSYSADLIIGLCEGPISGIGVIWKDQSTYTLSQLGLTLFDGTTPQTVWGYIATAAPTQALAYQGTAYLSAASYQLGDNASIGNHNFEAIGVLAGTGQNGIDADPAQVIGDFLTNSQYGCGFSSAAIDATTLYGSGGDASLQTYCRAQGISFSPALVTQEQGSSILTRWLQILNCAAVWSGGKLKFIPYGDVAISAGNVARSGQWVVPQPPTDAAGVTPAPSISVSAASAFVSDGGVTYVDTGAALASVGSNPGAGQYVAAAGLYTFSGSDEGRAVAISFTGSIAVSYVPNLTPVYDLSDLDFVSDGENKDPVTASRLDPFSLATIQRVEVLSRSNQYGVTPVEARDQSQIELFGPRVGSTIQAHEIGDEVIVGPIVAQTILQRGLYVRAHFTFKLSWEYCLLDPMDIVTINDANLGLVAYPVRLVTLEEDDHGIITVTAEELVDGISTPALYANNGTAGYQPNRGVAAASINTPLIYEPPPSFSSNIAQVWVGASGGAGGVADPNWGGAYVWASVDNVSYDPIGTITQPLRQGVLTAALASASGWDTTNTLAVSLVESGGVLSGTSAASAQAGSTLALVDYELLAYENATLTGTNAYNLTGLQRGFGGSTGASHANGAPFARLDDAVIKYNLPTSWIGVPLYFKFQSYNVFGGGVQALSACTAYTYTPTGGSSLGPVSSALAAGTALDYGSVTATINEYDNWGLCHGADAYPIAVIDLGNCTS